MTEHQIALARRAVAAPGWRWLPGMRIAGTKFARVVAVRDSDPCGAEEGPTGDDNAAVWLDDWTTATLLPDLADPATLGCLLALVRERWGTTAHLVRFDTNVDDGEGGTKPACWWALAVGLASRPFQRWDGRLRYIAAPTEVEALILALEATP